MAKTMANNPFEINKALNSNPMGALLKLSNDKTIRKDNIIINLIREMIENFRRFMRYNAYSMMKGLIPFTGKTGEGVDCGYYDYAKTADYQLKMSQLKSMLGITPLYDHPYIQEKYELLKSIYPDASFRMVNGEFQIIERVKLSKEELKEQKQAGKTPEKFRTDIEARLFVMNEEEYNEFRKSLVIGNEDIGITDKFRPEMLVREAFGHFVVNVDCPEVRAFVGKTLLQRHVQNVENPLQRTEEPELESNPKDILDDIKQEATPNEEQKPFEEKEYLYTISADGTSERTEIKSDTDWKYYVVQGEETSHCVLLKYTGTADEVTLPVELDSIPVKEITSGALYGTSVKTVNIPEGSPLTVPMPDFLVIGAFTLPEIKGYPEVLQAKYDELNAQYTTSKENKEEWQITTPVISTLKEERAQAFEQELLSNGIPFIRTFTDANMIAYSVNDEQIEKTSQILQEHIEKIAQFSEEKEAPKEQPVDVPTEKPAEPEPPVEEKKPGKIYIYEHHAAGGGLAQYHFHDKESAIAFEEKLTTNDIPFKKLSSLENKTDYAIRDIDKEQVDKLLGVEKQPEKTQEQTVEAKKDLPIKEKLDIPPDKEPFSKESMTSHPEQEIFKVTEVEIQPNYSMRVMVNGLECYLYEAGDAKAFEVFDVAMYRGNNKNVVIPSKLEFNGSIYSLESIYPGAFEGKDVETIQIDATGLEDIISNKEALTEAFCLGRDISGKPKFPTIYWTGLTESQYELFKQDMTLAEKFLSDSDRKQAPDRVVDIPLKEKKPEQEPVQEQKQEKEPEVSPPKEPKTPSIGKKKPNKGIDI